MRQRDQTFTATETHKNTTKLPQIQQPLQEEDLKEPSQFMQKSMNAYPFVFRRKCLYKKQSKISDIIMREKAELKK